jgi:hypothetical protein
LNLTFIGLHEYEGGIGIMGRQNYATTIISTSLEIGRGRYTVGSRVCLVKLYSIDIIVRAHTPSLLLSLPFELREKIWQMVLSPTVLFSIYSADVYSRENPSLRNGKPPTEYIGRLKSRYGKRDKDGPSLSVKCESVNAHKYFDNYALVWANKQIYSETISILSSVSKILATGLNGKEFKEDLSEGFLRIVANSKVSFNCHI